MFLVTLIQKEIIKMGKSYLYTSYEIETVDGVFHIQGRNKCLRWLNTQLRLGNKIEFKPIKKEKIIKEIA
jgi:hypothetical protein